jgi:hypothetical protein
MSEKAQGMLTMPQLKERGWTEAMVRDLLGEPDRRAPNPHYRSAPPMRLWAPERVTAIEAGEDFAARLKSGKTRSAASVAAADKRREQLLAAVESIPVTVPVIDDRTLAAEAIANRNAARAFHYSGAPREDERVDPDAPDAVDSATLDRWKVNYLRHRLTDYERHLEEVAGKVGVRDAKDLIREKVYDAIADAYPGLAAECLKQAQDRSALNTEKSDQ